MNVKSVLHRALLGATVMLAALGVAPIAPAHADPPPNSGSWTNSFTDNFDSLNTNVWHNGFPAWDNGYHDSAYRFQGFMPDADPATLNQGKNVWTANGNLVIQARQESNRGGGKWTTGYINSANRKTFLFGYFEIRAKFTSSQGQDPGFWLFPNRYGWPPEIDIVEIPGRGNGNEAQFNGHWRSDGKTTDFTTFAASRNSPYSVATDPNNYHTYACLWDPDKMIFYFDGVEVHRIVGHSPQIEMSMNIAHEIDRDSGGFYGEPNNGVYPSTQYVDYVKVWTHNGGASVPQLDETDLTNVSGATITARGDHGPNEVKENAFDNNTNSKWLDFGTSARTSWIRFDFPSSQKKVASRLAVTSAGDSPERYPRDIHVYGVKDDNTWVTLTAATLPASYPYKRNIVDFSNTTAYKGYVLGVDSVQNNATANSVQVAEIEWIQVGSGANAGDLVNGGIYEIEAVNSSGAGSGTVLDANGNANLSSVRVISRVSGRSNQRWRLENQSDGTTEIIPQNATVQRMEIDAAGGAGTRVQLYPDGNTTQQHWRLVRQSDGTYKITAGYNSSLVVQNNGSGQATAVNSSGATNQRWIFNLK